MKVQPSPNYSVKVIPEVSQYEGSERPFFEGIYRVVLNHTIPIVLVPPGGYTMTGLPPEVTFESVEDITSTDDARLYTLLNESYCITSLPDNKVPPTGYVLMPTYPGSDSDEKNLLFILPEPELEQMVDTIQNIYDLQCETYPDSLEYQLIKRTYIIRFIEEVILPNPHFGGFEKKLLGR